MVLTGNWDACPACLEGSLPEGRVRERPGMSDSSAQCRSTWRAEPAGITNLGFQKSRTLTKVKIGHSRDKSPLRLLRAVLRSEEHTSELQSLRHLVCRL